MKENAQVFAVVIGCLLLILGAVAGAVYLSSGSSTKSKCSTKGTNYTVNIEDDKAMPEHIDASLCDTLTIINKDDRARIMAFGQHDEHQSYDGISERVLNKDQSLKVTLNKLGTYIFHDHIGDTVEGTFTVR